MVSTSRIEEGQSRWRGLLDASEQFEVWSLDGDQLVPGRIEHANLATVEGGVLEFWHVVDNIWHQVAVFAPGYWSSFLPVAKEHQDAVAPPEAPTGLEYSLTEGDTLKDIVGQANPSLEASLGTPAPEPNWSDKSQGAEERRRQGREMRDQIRADLAAGVFPQDKIETISGTISPPRQLKDVWEGKGEAIDDGEEDDGWPRNVDQEAVDKWVAEQNAKEEKRVEELRAESDAEFEKHPQPADRLPEHLKDVSAPFALNKDYTSLRVPYTTMIGTDGTLPNRTDREGVPVTPPADVTAYSEKIAAAANDAVAYGRQQREIVEDWHGRSEQSS